MSKSVFLVLLLASTLRLSAAEIAHLRGRIQTPDHQPILGLSVLMEEFATHSRTGEVDVRIDGSFEFRDVPLGDYTLIVADRAGHTVYQQYVDLQERLPEIEVRLPERDSPPLEGGRSTISFTELTHPADKKAVQAWRSALRLSSAGKYDAAAGELEKAVTISPQFTAAHTNLAAQYFRLGRYQQSAAESAKAIAIGGPDPLNLCNLAMAQARLQQYAEAEKAARASLRLDSGYLKASMILGFLLVDDPATRSEGIENLERAAAEFKLARQFLDRLRQPAEPRRTSAGDVGK